MKNFLGIGTKYSEFNASGAVIIPVPFEQTTSYMPGTAKGPQAILDASAYVELYDEELKVESYLQGIHTLPPLTFSGRTEDDFEQIAAAFEKVLAVQKFPVGLGGEHSVSFPTVKAFKKYFSDLSVLQLDAHSDLRYSYEASLYSHASVMRRIFEITPNIVPVGIRSQCNEEAEFITRENLNTFYAYRLRQEGFDSSILDALTENVFITIDVDFFDPAVMPATGTPEPGGFFWYETLEFLKQVFTRKNVVGFDVVELSPISNLVYPDFTVAKLIYKLLGYHFLK